MKREAAPEPEPSFGQKACDVAVSFTQANHKYCDLHC